MDARGCGHIKQEDGVEVEGGGQGVKNGLVISNVQFVSGLAEIDRSHVINVMCEEAMLHMLWVCSFESQTPN